MHQRSLIPFVSLFAVMALSGVGILIHMEKLLDIVTVSNMGFREEEWEQIHRRAVRNWQGVLWFIRGL